MPDQPSKGLALGGDPGFPNLAGQKGCWRSLNCILYAYLVENSLELVQFQRGVVWVDVGLSKNLPNINEFAKLRGSVEQVTTIIHLSP